MSRKNYRVYIFERTCRGCKQRRDVIGSTCRKGRFLCRDCSKAVTCAN